MIIVLYIVLYQQFIELQDSFLTANTNSKDQKREKKKKKTRNRSQEKLYCNPNIFLRL